MKFRDVLGTPARPIRGNRGTPERQKETEREAGEDEHKENNTLEEI